MGFFALVLALLIEQSRPLRPGNRVHSAFAGFAAMVRRNLDGGERRHGAIGWAVVVGGSVAAVMLVESIARAIHPLVLFALHVFVLYCTVGFRQFSQAFTEIRIALAADDAEGARRVLSGWLRGEDPAEEAFADRETTVAGTCRQAIAHALLAAHRHVLGPLFCYIVLPGALGPVLYRVAEMLARHWQRQDRESPLPEAAGASAPFSAPLSPSPSPWSAFATRAFAVIDWIPVRLTAAGFAIVGDFEDAVYCWRGANAAVGHWDSRSVLMAVGSGALGVRLADPALAQRWAGSERPFECPGGEAQPASLPGAAGLVWRSLLLWIGLFALITVSAWMGR
ncbi:MAG: hypothetical protein ABS55_11555 [Lautropia sp. SCN 70-15]|nr:MAG: hypothetical protein ABS55_11555 [Lautropia sp. SCN 70-15]